MVFFFFLPVLVPPSVKPVVDFDPKRLLPKPTEGADVVAVAVAEPRVPKLSPPVELLQNKTISNYFFKIKKSTTHPPLNSISFPCHHSFSQATQDAARQDKDQAHCHQTERGR